MAKQLYDKTVTEVGNGVHLDSNPLTQPQGTRRFTLNAVEQSFDGQENKVSNEPANVDVAAFPPGYHPIGDCYIEDDTSFVILVSPVTDRTLLGLVTKDNWFTQLVDTAVLGHRITHQCDIKYRLRRGNERVFYWVDGQGLAKTVNIDRLYNFYSKEYQDYLNDPVNNTPPYELWDSNSFNLIKTFSLTPVFEGIEVVENGSILPGSYNFAIQLVDEDLNPTAWITTSNTVNIYNDSISNSYERVRGSRNVQSDAQSFPRASKSIRLNLSHLDQSFPYYRVAIIRAAGNTGSVDKVLASDLQSTSQSAFVYAGNDGSLTEVTLEDILIEHEAIFAPQHIEQFENTLILANMRGKEMNWCEYQKFASKISSDLTTESVILNSVQSPANVKAAESTFKWMGYMPGEVYSYGICYKFPDFISPVFHIPGRNMNSTESLMKYHSLPDSRYLDVHNCSTSDYWGVDAKGETLLGKPVRHHRFPFRKDLINSRIGSKPLIKSTAAPTTVNKYKLTVKFALNPGYIPPPPGTTVPIPYPIGYTFLYTLSGVTTESSYGSILTDSDISMGIETTIYNGSTPLANTYPGDAYTELDPDCDLQDYTDRFIITTTYVPYVVDSITSKDESWIFGIEFSGIENPAPGLCTGFYIVRNERTEDDRMVLDNAIFGGMTQKDQYKSFGLIMPKQYYHAINCGKGHDSGRTLSYFKRGTWFFNPEFQYFQRKLEFDRVEIEGTYSETRVDLPSISNIENSECNNGGDKKMGTKGVYINDVMAGTSYDPEVNKKEDKGAGSDGFDLVVGYRNTTIAYKETGALDFLKSGTKDKTIYLNAASYQNLNGNTYYNVSVDNKIGMFLTKEDMTDTDISNFYNTGTNKNGLVYGAMVRDTPLSYSNFTERTYYKEHNNAIPFQDNIARIDGVRIFNGDARISAFNFTSSVFYDMVMGTFDKKSRVWKIIVGAVLVAAAVTVTIVTAFTAAPLAIAAIGALSGAAISIGVSLATSGLKFEQMKSMIDVDYKKGLDETVTDGGVFECLDKDNLGGENNDDTIRWFADRVSNIYMESSVPFGLRSGLTGGVVDFTDAPAQYNELGFRSYLTEKLTNLDRQQGSGRLYKGFATSEIYDMNLDFMRFNKEKLFFHLPVQYDCCSDYKERFPVRWRWSQQSFQEEKTDNFAAFLPNNYRDIEGEHGEITDLYRLGNNLFIQTKECLWQVPKNNQERVTGEIISFIGTGELFSIPPVKVVDDTLGSGGTSHKWATVKTKFGVISVSETQRRINLHGNSLTNIADTGIGSFFEENLRSFLPRQLFDAKGVTFPLSNNPANPYGIGYLTAYDTRWERIIITKRDYLILPDKLELLNTPGSDFTYDVSRGIFYKGTTPLQLNNSEYFENKSFTVSYSFRGNRSGWTSWHSYIPNYYIHTQNNMYSYIAGDSLNRLWRHNERGYFQRFYNTRYPFIIEGVALASPLTDRTFEDMTLQTHARVWDADRREYVEARHITFNSLLIYTNTQCSGELNLIVKETQGTPANWLFQQVVNTPGSILASRRINDWHINGLRDYLTDATIPIFTKKWDDIKSNFYIDKLLNTPVVDFTKLWHEQKSFRDKYIVFRLKFDNFDDVNLITNYSVITDKISNE